MNKTVKIQDVAKVAKVSTATVSRTLSNPSVVSEATRNAVLDAVKQTGYRVNRAARNLRTQRANAILVLLPDMGNPFFSQILQGIESVLSPSGFSMLIADTGQIAAAGDRLADYLNDGRADGLVILDGGLDKTIVDELSEFQQRDNIVCACEWLDNTDFPSVRSANRRGSRAAVEHLIDLGHQKIAHVTGPTLNVLTEARRHSFVETLTDHKLLQHEKWIISGDFSLQSGRDAALKIMEMKDRPTAVFCASDQIAFGMIAEFAKQGINVPEQMSIIGFDDIELSEHYIPALTTMRQDRFSLGRQAAEMLLAQFSAIEKVKKPEAVIMDVALIIRDSTASPKK